MASNVWLESIWQDVRFGVRDLIRDKGFTATAVLSLALGIMGSTAMYSVIYGVVLEPFPYRDVDSLMSVAVHNRERPSWRTYYSVDEFLEIREHNRIFTGTIASTISDVLWTGDGEPRRLRGNHITRDTFEVMGVPALLGRTVSSSDTEPERLAVLGFKCWQRDFGGDPNVLGKTLRLNDKLRTIVGVMPARFMWRGADVYLPLEYQRGQVKESVRYVHVLGRLKPGMTEAQAQADLSPIIEDLKRRDPSAFPEKHRVGIISFKETFPSGLRGTLWVLFGAVGLLLLIACVNVSNLLLVKASGRTREMAVRASLGASRVRLMRQLLTESILLGLAGGVIGVFGAHVCLRAILAVLPQGVVPDESEIVINGPVLIFSALLSVATAILFGVAPAFQTAGRDLSNPLKESGRSVTGAKRGQRVRNALVVLEVTLSLILLAGAGLMLRTLLRVQTADLAVRMDHQLTLRIPLPTERYAETPRRVAFWEEILSRVRTTPGVEAAGLNTGLHPFGNWGFPVEVPSSTHREGRPVTLHQVDTEYMRTFGISLVRGRPLAAPDLAAARRVAVVNEEFVRRYFDTGSPLGHVVRIPRLRQPPFRLTEDGFEIVGVVKNALYDLQSGEAQAELYFPYTIAGMADRLVVRTGADPALLAGAVRAQVYAVDRNQPVTDVRTLESLMQEWVLARPRFRVILFAVFAVVGLAMAVIGVYGVLSNIVSQQRQQIGVRMAVGATSSDILRMLLKSGLRLVLSGVIAGLGASIALARLLRRQLSMAEAFDPAAFAVVSLLLLVAGASASLIPALRATRVDPVSALRVE